MQNRKSFLELGVSQHNRVVSMFMGSVKDLLHEHRPGYEKYLWRAAMTSRHARRLCGLPKLRLRVFPPPFLVDNPSQYDALVNQLQTASKLSGAKRAWHMSAALLPWAPHYTRTSLVAALGGDRGPVTRWQVDAARGFYRQYSGMLLGHYSERTPLARVRMPKDKQEKFIECAFRMCIAWLTWCACTCHFNMHMNHRSKRERRQSVSMPRESCKARTGLE
jgi:hypothetical protein